MKAYQNVTGFCYARKSLTAFTQSLQLQVIWGTSKRFSLRGKQPDHKCTLGGYASVSVTSNARSQISMMQYFPPWFLTLRILFSVSKFSPLVGPQTSWHATNTATREWSKVTNVHRKILQCLGQPGFTTLRHWKGIYYRHLSRKWKLRSLKTTPPPSSGLGS